MGYLVVSVILALEFFGVVKKQLKGTEHHICMIIGIESAYQILPGSNRCSVGALAICNLVC